MKWFIGIGAILGLALVLQAGLIAFAMYVVLGVLLLSRYLVRAWVTGLRVERQAGNAELDIGSSIDVRLLVHNTGKLPIPWLLLEDLLPRGAFRRRPPAVSIKGKYLRILSIRSGKEVVVSYKVTFQQRGFYQIGPVVLETGDLFGFYRRHRVLTKPIFVLVYPKVLPLPKYDFASQRPIGEINLIHQLYEDPTRTAGVRPYQSGDPLSRVHWRATARTGQLHSRIFDPTTLAGATIVLDLHRASYPERGEPYRSDLAVTLAASLAYAVSSLNQQVGLAVNGRDAAERIRYATARGEKAQAEQPTDPNTQAFFSRAAARAGLEEGEDEERLEPLVVPTRRGLEQFQRIRETLARVELADGLDFCRLLLEVTPRLPRDATVIAILGAVSVETSIALGTLRRQGFAISVILVMLDDNEGTKAHGRLLAAGIRDVRHVASEAEIILLGAQTQPGAAAYHVETQLV